VVEEIAHGVKVAVDGAVAWAEKKVEELTSEGDSTGPYTSPATCAPSDMDVIASGVLPGMPTETKSEDDDKEEEDAADERNK
jgi:hypothetical protein